MNRIKPTRYYAEFLRYYQMASIQQRECNLGTIPHMEGSVKDDLMRHVELYDVVNRKYAGFTQILLDMWFGDTAAHPYAEKMHSVRKPIAKSFNGIHEHWGLREWLYVFIVHRVTGSGINYAKKPSGYNNTVLPEFAWCIGAKGVVTPIQTMVASIKNRASLDKPFYTSVGYQFPAFPKPTEEYRRGGDYFLCEFAPRLAEDLEQWLLIGKTRQLREIGDFMFAWNKQNGLRAYKFQYAAVIADIADFFPQYVNLSSMFYYGTNARECLKLLAEPLVRMKEDDFLDEIMVMACKDTGGVSYDVEDVACDFVRWIENYVRPGHDYDHVDRDKVWNSSKIIDHPYGRQKAMLDMKLVQSFNNLKVHASGDYVLSRLGMGVNTYRSNLWSHYEPSLC